MTSRRRLPIAAFFTLAFVTAAASAEPAGPVGPVAVPGWPVVLGGGMHCAPAVADFDGDGRDELVQPLRDGRVFLLDGRGRIAPGWPVALAGGVNMSPLVADLDDDGQLEIVAVSRDGFAHAWRQDGRRLPGWPVDLEGAPVSAPLLVPAPAPAGPGLAIAVEDGTVHLLDGWGRPRTGWPRHGGSQRLSAFDSSPLACGDLDGDGRREILYLSRDEAVLSAWRDAGEDVPGFPVALGGDGVGVAIAPDSGPARLACATTRGIVGLDARGRREWTLPLPADGDEIVTAPAFLASGPAPEQAGAWVQASTQQGKVLLLDRGGRPLPGWPVHLGGFIYGLSGQLERFPVFGHALSCDTDADGDREIVVGCYDQHLYCFDERGRLQPGWPLILDDSVYAGPVLAQLDGEGSRELVVGQVGEALFAYDLVPAAGRAARALPPRPDRSSAREWRREYFGVAAALAALLGLLGLAVRRRTDARNAAAAEPAGSQRALRWLVAAVAALLLARAGLLVVEAVRYARVERRLASSEPLARRVVALHLAQTAQRAAAFAAALDSCGALAENDPIRLHYLMEQVADRLRLDEQDTGVLIAGPNGEVLRGLGLARGWTRLDELGAPGLGVAAPDVAAPNIAAPLLLGATPVHAGAARVGSPGAGRTLYLFSSLLGSLPQDVASATGFAALLRLGGWTLAWGGGSGGPFVRAWPWLGLVEPARDLTLASIAPATTLEIRLADENFPSTLPAWLDVLLVLLLPALLLAHLRRRAAPATRPGGLWWIVPFLLLSGLGWMLWGQGSLAQRPVSLTGHGLEVALALASLLGLAVAAGWGAGTRRERRLSLALLGSYLAVGLLPLVVVLLIGASLVQRAQREVIGGALAELETRAQHLAMAYTGASMFINSLDHAAEQLLDESPETGWFNFVAEDQYLFTHDLPTAYLTLLVQDRRDPRRHFTGYSWLAPRTEKFFGRWPDWIGEESPAGLFLDRGVPIVRAVQPLRTMRVDARFVSHIPLDATIRADLEARLRILPFLPRVDLRPAYNANAAQRPSPAGWRLPFATRLVVPARDWRTGAPRWLAFLAEAYLPPGRETWTVLSSLILLTLLPLGLSFWGAWSTYQRTVRPLGRLLTGIRRVETGDFDYRLADAGSSQVARAAQAFDRMAQSLQNQVQVLAEKKKLEEVSALKSRFISMVSHDLKTPLAAIRGAAENVAGELAGPVTDRQRLYMNMILESSGSLQQMIGDLLDLSRLEGGHLRLSPETVDLRHEAETVLRSVQPLLEKKRLRASVAVVGTAPTLALADPARLWQILGNVLGNAIRHSPEGGSLAITIAAVAEDGREGARRWRTTIEDDGPGVPEEERARLFEPFYALAVAGQAAPGAGLGLAIVKQLVELHGGQVRLENRPGGGARLSFTLPAA